MNKRIEVTIIILGVYEIVYAFRLFWNLINSKLNSIFIADIIFIGKDAKILFGLFGLFGLAVGFGLIYYKRWAFWGMIVLNSIFMMIYVSNLIFIDTEDFLRVYRNVSSDALLRYRITIGWKLFIVTTLVIITFLCRNGFARRSNIDLKAAG